GDGRGRNGPENSNGQGGDKNKTGQPDDARVEIPNPESSTGGSATRPNDARVEVPNPESSTGGSATRPDDARVEVPNPRSNQPNGTQVGDQDKAKGNGNGNDNANGNGNGQRSGSGNQSSQGRGRNANQPAVESAPATGGAPAASLGIASHDLPQPGKCRLWIPNRSASQQAKAGNCRGMDSSAPAGAWVLYRPSRDREVVHVQVIDAARAGVVTQVKVYDAETGRYLRNEGAE
ncbi:MAG: hypothetical protein ACYTFO_10445, partial [Planctomycetota bacterium]